MQYGLASICVLVAQSYPTLSKSMDFSLPDSSVHGILQVRILNWVAIPFSRGLSQPRDWPLVFHIAGRFFTVWATRESWPGEQVILWVKYASVCRGFLQYLEIVNTRKAWKNSICYRQGVGCCKERALQDQQIPTTDHTNFWKYSVMSVMGNDPFCFFPNSSHSDEGAVKRQAVKVPWEFGRRALVLSMLPTWGHWLMSLNHRFILCVLRWLTRPAACSTFFCFMPCNTPCKRDHRLYLCQVEQTFLLLPQSEAHRHPLFHDSRVVSPCHSAQTSKPLGSSPISLSTSDCCLITSTS